MSADESLELEIKQLIITALALEDVTPADIETEAPLFNDGLGLDSIDSLDLAMVLEERYGVDLSKDSGENRRRFASVRALARFITAERKR
jgi:acyl carrier protein